jgi:hypothetical protein
VTNVIGSEFFVLPDGDYLVIGDDGTDKHLGVSVGSIGCGDSALKHLRRIVTASGAVLSGKTSRRAGSELLIVEPEYVEWSGDMALYPVVFDSQGDWSVTTSVAPPEGFVADNDDLSADVTSQVEAVQFVITDVGSEWVPTKLKHKVEHGRRKEKVLSRVGVMLSAELARQKGLHRLGYDLDENGNPILPRGFDRRAKRPSELIGWIEPSEGDPSWTIKLRVNETSELRLAVTGRGSFEQSLVEGVLTAGDYEFVWQAPGSPGNRADESEYFITLVSGDMEEIEPLADQRRKKKKRHW